MRKKNYFKCIVVLTLVFLLTACESPLPKPDPDELSTTKVLMEDKLTFYEGEDRWVLGNNSLARSSIVTITFLDTLEDMPEEKTWDVSQEQNGTVMAWIKPTEQAQSDFEGYDLYIAAEGGIMASSGDSLFAGYENVKEIRFNNCFHTDEVTNMYAMFHSCGSLKNIDLSNFDTSQVTDMYCMFYDCNHLEQIDLNSFDTGKVTNMGHMFSKCKTLTEINLSDFNTSQVTSMFAMFNDCRDIKELDLSKFNTSQVINMNSMFYDCTSLEKIDLSSFDTSKVTNMGHMFHECSSLRSLDLISFNTSQVTDMGSMFYDCSNLKELDLSDFDLGQITDIENILYNAGITAQEAGLPLISNL